MKHTLFHTLVSYLCFIPLFHTPVSYPCFIPLFHTLVSYPCFIPPFCWCVCALLLADSSVFHTLFHTLGAPNRGSSGAWRLCAARLSHFAQRLSSSACFGLHMKVASLQKGLFHTLVSYPCFIPLFHTPVSYPRFIPLFHSSGRGHGISIHTHIAPNRLRYVVTRVLELIVQTLVVPRVATRQCARVCHGSVDVSAAF